MRALKVAGACVYACVCVVLTSLYAVFVLVCANVSLCLHVCNFSGLLYVHVERNHQVGQEGVLFAHAYTFSSQALPQDLALSVRLPTQRPCRT